MGEFPRRAGRRRLPESLDQSQRRKHYPDRQRSRRHHHGERRRSWSSWYNQPTAQLYHAITDNSFPYRVCGGQQESGSVCISSRGNDGAITFRDWHPVGVIEYGYVAPDPLDPDVVYGGGRTEVSKFHWSTGQVQNVTPIPLRDPKYRTNRTEPLMFSPVDPHILIFRQQRAVQNYRWRQLLADNQPRLDARESRACPPAWAHSCRRARKTARRNLRTGTLVQST